MKFEIMNTNKRNSVENLKDKIEKSLMKYFKPSSQLCSCNIMDAAGIP